MSAKNRKWVLVTGTQFLCFLLGHGLRLLRRSCVSDKAAHSRPQLQSPASVLGPGARVVSPTHVSRGGDPGIADLPLPVGSCHEAAVF